MYVCIYNATYADYTTQNDKYKNNCLGVNEPHLIVNVYIKYICLKLCHNSDIQ